MTVAFYFIVAPDTFAAIESRNRISSSIEENPRETLSLWSALCISTKLPLQQAAHFRSALALSNSTCLPWLLSLSLLEINDSSASPMFWFFTMMIGDSSGIDTTRTYSSTFGDKILMRAIVIPPWAIALSKVDIFYMMKQRPE